MPDGPWWKTGVIYQIAVPSFADSNGDGIGDLRGVISHLDHLAGAEGSLGVDAIWLTPINTTPMRDFGYDVVDHLGIDPRFGTMADFQDLLAECHTRGIRVMMDLVLNHTSDEHPWFAESRASRDNPRRSWYVWRDGKRPGVPPNRWETVIESSSWEHDPATGQWYYHAFLPFQPDLNWRNPDVRDEMMGVARYWLGTGVDGFRLDLINYLYEDAHLRENPRRISLRPYARQRHIHDQAQPESLKVVEELRRLADGFGGRVLMGEVLTDNREDCAAFAGEGCNRLHLSTYPHFVSAFWGARRFAESVTWLERHLAEGAWPCYYLDNHDIPRSYSHLGFGGNSDARARVAAAMLLTLRGTPIIYYGQELGMPQSRIPRRLQRDPVGRRYWPFGLGRDGCRTPMQWSAEEGAGFTTGSPWLPVNRSVATRNVAAELADEHSLLAWYRRLLALRREHPALAEGSFRMIEHTPRAVFAYAREAAGEQVAVVLNFSRWPRRITLPDGEWRVLASTHRTEGADLAGAVPVAGCEVVLMVYLGTLKSH